MAVLGVIGGSGIYDLGELHDSTEHEVETPFGTPSGIVRRGMIGPTDILFIARHGLGHVHSPSDVPYRANIYALKQLGATHLLSLSAVGSLREDHPPRTLVVPDQVIDRTLQRERSFFDRGVVAHVGVADPFCARFQETLEHAAASAGQPVRRGGTYVCIEGPQFSTRAESHLYRSWGATVIGMTAMPEARLAREAELCYTTLAMVTDYDVWHASEADVSVDVVMENLQANSDAAATILRAVALGGLPERSCRCDSALSDAIMTAPVQITDDIWERIGLLVGDRVPLG